LTLMAILEPLGRPLERSHDIPTSGVEYITVAPELSTLQVITALSLYSPGSLDVYLRLTASGTSSGVNLQSATIQDEEVTIIGGSAEEVRSPPGFEPNISAKNTGSSQATLYVRCAGYYRLQGRL